MTAWSNQQATHELGLDSGGRDPQAGDRRQHDALCFPRIALMPDAHLGKGATVGSVLPTLHRAIAQAIPLAAGKYDHSITSTAQSRIAELEALDGYEQAEAIAPNWRQQVGSLGSGNHFIEISLDENGRVWLFLHFGSRGIGNKLAMKHIKVAVEQCTRRHTLHQIVNVKGD
jgi:tRNA-splicing ligase RtcB